MPPPPPLLPTAPSARPCRLLPRPSPSPHWPPPLVCASCGQKRRARASAVIEHERRRILSSLSSSDPDAAPQADETRLGGAADGGGQGDPPGAANDGSAGMSSPVERCIHIQQPVHHHAPEGEGEPRAREPILVNGGWIRCGAQPSSEIEKAISFYTIRGATKVVRVRDCVLMRPSDTHNASYVARVESLESDGRGSVRVRRYYPPEESKGGRRQFHGAKCRFLSDHIDTQSAHTIEGKCIVHCFKNYTKLDNVGPKTSSTDASTRKPPGRSPRLCHRVL